MSPVLTTAIFLPIILPLLFIFFDKRLHNPLKFYLFGVLVSYATFFILTPILFIVLMAVLKFFVSEDIIKNIYGSMIWSPIIGTVLSSSFLFLIERKMMHSQNVD